MRAHRDPYIAWISASAIAFAWVGALLFPWIVRMPLKHPMFWVCAGAGLLVAATVADGVRAKRHGQASGFVAKAVVPLILLGVGTVFSIVAA